MEKSRKEKWVYSILFYLGVFICIFGLNTWWMMTIGLVTMITVRYKELNRKEEIRNGEQ